MALPVIPTVESLRSVSLRHRFGDIFNPPGLTNFLGGAQAALDPTGIRSISFPPLALGEVPPGPMVQAQDGTTGSLFLDGEYALASGEPVAFTWQPDRIDRQTRNRHLSIETTTITPMGKTAAMERISVVNQGTRMRTFTLQLHLRANVFSDPTVWGSPMLPAAFNAATTVDAARGAVIFRAASSGATWVQGAWPPPDQVADNVIGYTIHLRPGETWRSTFAVSLGANPQQALSQYDGIVRNFDHQLRATRDRWNDELHAAFTPGNTMFSGHLPILDSDDPDLLRLYHTAVISLLQHKRESPNSVHGPTYVTLGPRYWQTTTFLWDISLASNMLALLDPASLRSMVEEWMRVDVHKHFGTDYLTGDGVGPWYSVNDYAMCRMAREYLRWSGDTAWLDTIIAGKPVFDHLVAFATNWRTLNHGDGLADYGDVNNLLEAVGTYTHEVAAMNAANVDSLQFVAELLDGRNRKPEAAALRMEANRLAQEVKKLYVPGQGVWQARAPDGSMRPVRHAYDFATVLTTMDQYLSAQQKNEMAHFFETELMTPTWMRALSKRDLDATFSTRPDHQWTGAFAAWPAMSLSALYKAGKSVLARKWMHGLALTTRQGPIAQAYFAEDAIPREPHAGARKAPSDAPWINDWSAVAGAAFMEPIVRGLFGVETPLRGAMIARPRLAGRDRKARLLNLSFHGKNYSVDERGVHDQPVVRGIPQRVPGRELAA